MFKVKGMTLIELMVSVAITAIVSTIGIPSLSKFLIQLRVDNEISRLHRLIITTRNFAINQSTNITLCPLVANVCSTNWQQELSVFIDGNNNGVFEPSNNERIIQVKAAINVDDDLLYGSGRTAIMFNPQGRLNGWGQNGTFRYCPNNHVDYARGLRVAVSGRVYQTSDNDSDGKDEDRNNQELSCN